jgi:hypothetical protein
MDAFVDGDGPQAVDGIPRTDTSTSNPFRIEPDLMSFGASTTLREHSPSPTAQYRPPEDLLRSPTPSPNRVGAERSARRDAANEYDRTAAATEQQCGEQNAALKSRAFAPRTAADSEARRAEAVVAKRLAQRFVLGVRSGRMY